MWILIMSMFTYTGAGVATAEFSSHKSCEAAGEKWKESQPSRELSYLCVPKDDHELMEVGE